MEEMKARRFNLYSKMLLGLSIMSTVLVIILAPLLGGLYRERMEAYYSELAFNQATVTSHFIDGDRIMEYYRTLEADEYYERVCTYMEDVKQVQNLKYFYVVVMEEDRMIYIWDAGDPGAVDIAFLGDYDDYSGTDYETMKAVLDGSAEQTIQISTSRDYGYLASAYAPIANSKGENVALVGVDISMEMINRQILRVAVIILVTVLAVQLVCSAFYQYYVSRVLIDPIKTLHSSTKSLIQNDMERLGSFTVDVHTGDELEDLGKAFEYMTRELSDYIANLTSATVERERIESEMNIATRIQAGMLPYIFPAFPDQDEFDIYATMNPAKEVGGDFYDFFMVDENHLAMVIADVSGKGVPAALFMMMSKTLLKNAAKSGLSPAQVLEKVNNQLCENNIVEMFVTAWLGILDLTNGRMLCANAGHEYPAICRAGGDFELFKDKHGFVLAGMDNAKYREYELELHAGDVIYVYTDGVTEATDGDKQLYGTGRMTAALNRLKDCSCDELLHGMKNDIDAFVGEAPQFDDITMLCFRLFKIDELEEK